MQLENEEKEFGYQFVLKSCTIQAECRKNADEQNAESQSHFYEGFKTKTELKSERNQNKKIINNLKLANKKNLLKAENMQKELNVIMEQMANYLRQNEDLHLQMRKLSDELTESILTIDGDLEKLKSEFEDDALSINIKNITNDLLSYRDAEYQFEDHFKTEMLPTDSREYAIDITAQKIFDQFSKTDKKYKDPLKIIGDEEKNNQFLTNELKKNDEMIKNFEMQ